MAAAAWSAPVILLTTATPAAAASLADSGVAWTASSTALTVGTLAPLNLAILATGPTQFTITNGGTVAIPSFTGTLVITQTSGISLGANKVVLRSLTGATIASGVNTSSITFTSTAPIPAGGTKNVQVVFGLMTGTVGVGLLTGFSFVVTVDDGFTGGSELPDSAATTGSLPVFVGVVV